MIRRALALVLPLLLVAAACGSDDEQPTASSSTPDAAAERGDFPLTVEHMFGETTIDEVPERIVAIGYNEQDFVLALGEVPVGVREFLAYDYPARPWAQDALGDAEPVEVGGQELDLEAIAALEPDVILGIYSYMEEGDYEKLSAIAPTIAQSDEFPVGGVPWEDQLLVTGQVLGKADEAQAIVDDVTAEFEAAAAEHPEFEGKTLALDYFYDDRHYLLEPTDLRFRFFSSLGFEAPPTVGEVSLEQTDALDQDVLIIVGVTEEDLADDPVWQSIPAVKEGRVLYLGLFSQHFGGALGFGSPLSLSYALDVAVPRLAAVTDDDPATAPEPVTE